MSLLSHAPLPVFSSEFVSEAQGRGSRSYVLCSVSICFQRPVLNQVGAQCLFQTCPHHQTGTRRHHGDSNASSPYSPLWFLQIYLLLTAKRDHVQSTLWSTLQVQPWSKHLIHHDSQSSVTKNQKVLEPEGTLEMTFPREDQNCEGPCLFKAMVLVEGRTKWLFTIPCIPGRLPVFSRAPKM